MSDLRILVVSVLLNAAMITIAFAPDIDATWPRYGFYFAAGALTLAAVQVLAAGIKKAS